MLKLNLALHVEDERIGCRRRRSLGRPAGVACQIVENERRGRYLNELIYSAAVHVDCAVRPSAKGRCVAQTQSLAARQWLGILTAVCVQRGPMRFCTVVAAENH